MMMIANAAVDMQLIFRLKIEQFGERADDAGHLLHAGREVVIRAGLEVISDDFVDKCQHVRQLHRCTVLAEHPHQRLDEPRAVHVVTPREVACRSTTQVTRSRVKDISTEVKVAMYKPALQ